MYHLGRCGVLQALGFNSIHSVGAFWHWPQSDRNLFYFVVCPLCFRGSFSPHTLCIQAGSPHRQLFGQQRQAAFCKSCSRAVVSSRFVVMLDNSHRLAIFVVSFQHIGLTLCESRIWIQKRPKKCETPRNPQTKYLFVRCRHTTCIPVRQQPNPTRDPAICPNLCSVHVAFRDHTTILTDLLG